MNLGTNSKDKAKAEKPRKTLSSGIKPMMFPK